MEPLDRLRALLDGSACTVCEERVPGDRIRLLARRDDLAFVEIACPGCASTTLAFVVAADGLLSDLPIPGDRPPVSADDLLDMHVLLRSWPGDLRSLLERGPGHDAGHAR